MTLHHSTAAETPGPAAPTPPAASGLAVLLDIGAQFVQFTVTLGLAISLAGLLCVALVASSHQFSESVRSSRQAVRTNSVQTLAKRLQSVVGNAKPARPNEKVAIERNQRSLQRGTD